MSTPFFQLLQEAVACFRGGELPAAEARLGEALGIETENFDAWHLLGVVKASRGEHEAALAAYDEALRLNRTSAEAWCNKGSALLALHRDEAALSAFAHAVQSEPARAAAWYNKGVALGRLKRAGEALSAYDTALRLDPRLAVAWGNRGALLLEAKRDREALDAYDQAVALDRNYAAAWFGRACALNNLGRGEEALQAYDAALALAPHDAETWLNKGNAFSALGRHAEALAAYDAALALAPAYAQAWSNRGVCLNALQRRDEALAAFARAVDIDPLLATAWLNQGVLLREAERYEEALQAYRRALELAPTAAETYANIGNLLNSLKRHTEALVAYDKALSMRPDLAPAWSNKGVTLAALHRPAEALDAYAQALALDPTYAEAWYNRANLLGDLEQPEEALAAYDNAIAGNAACVPAWINKGAVLHDLQRHAEALRHYRQALALEPDNADARWNEALTRLALGDYRGGWRQYECRWHTLGHDLYRHADIPRPDSPAALARKRVLVWAEQGLGDTIQFCRYLPLLRQGGAETVFEVQPALVELLARQGLGPVVAMGAALPAVDFQIPLLSLPALFGTELDTIPAPAPYLRCDPAKREFWKERLGPAGRFRVGLVWAGGLRPGQPELRNVNRRRNIALAQFARLKHEHVEYFSLQKGAPAEAELAHLQSRGWDGPALVDYTRELNDFSDTAALVDNLDLVISVDTSTAHLAAALGKPVWLLNRFDSCWRWLRERNDTPWYPTLTLYRQARAGDWDGVLERVRLDLLTAADSAAESAGGRRPARTT